MPKGYILNPPIMTAQKVFIDSLLQQCNIEPLQFKGSFNKPITNNNNNKRQTTTELIKAIIDKVKGGHVMDISTSSNYIKKNSNIQNDELLYNSGNSFSSSSSNDFNYEEFLQRKRMENRTLKQPQQTRIVKKKVVVKTATPQIVKKKAIVVKKKVVIVKKKVPVEPKKKAVVVVAKKVVETKKKVVVKAKKEEDFDFDFDDDDDAPKEVLKSKPPIKKRKRLPAKKKVTKVPAKKPRRGRTPQKK